MRIFFCIYIFPSHPQFEEQQAFERSRRFLRQLEISFGENPSHYQKIVRALQSGSPLSPAGIEEVLIDGFKNETNDLLHCPTEIHKHSKAHYHSKNVTSDIFLFFFLN